MAMPGHAVGNDLAFCQFDHSKEGCGSVPFVVMRERLQSARINRDLGRKKWGDTGDAMEELVAELGSAFLCADLAITPEIPDDHTAYVSSWLKVLQDDKRAIFSAASLVSRAVEFLHSLQPQPDTTA